MENTLVIGGKAEKAMASHSSTLAWKIPWTEEPWDRKAAVHGVVEGQTRLSDFTFTFHFHALEKEMATHSGVLAWRIPGTGKPGGLPSMGSHRVGHCWTDLAIANSNSNRWERDKKLHESLWPLEWVSLEYHHIYGIGREMGGRLRMRNTCKPMDDSCQCMAKTTTIL